MCKQGCVQLDFRSCAVSGQAVRIRVEVQVVAAGMLKRGEDLYLNLFEVLDAL